MRRLYLLRLFREKYVVSDRLVTDASKFQVMYSKFS